MNGLDAAAQWISLRAVARRPQNQWIAFRKTVELDALPASLPVHIACDSKYWLWINGQLVVHEGQLKRGPTPYDSYCDDLDLAPHLVAGKNRIAILLWYFGKEGFCHKSSGVPALWVDSVAVVSDRSWRVREHPAFGTSAPPHPNVRLPESNIHFDARLDIPDWTQAGFDDSSWAQASELGTPPMAPWGELVPRPVPLWRTGDLMPYVNETDFPDGWLGNSLLRARLPGNLAVCPYLKIDAKPGLKISIYTDNYRGGSEYNIRADYVTKEGVQAFESPAYLTGHEVIYDLPVGVRVLELNYRPIGFDTDVVGSFDCSDPSLNTLWKKSANTMLLNLRDGIQDPDRERAQWWGDVVILIGMILHSCDARGRTAITKAIHNLVDWQKPDGTLYSPVPAGNWFQELPDQMLAAIGTYGFWTYYRYTGDRETIEHAYPAVKRYLDLWKTGSDGLVIRRTGGWDWGDWGENKDMPLLINGWFYMALESARNMAELLGETEDHAHWQSLMDGLRGSFNRTFWTGTEYRSPEHDGPPDDRGQALAVVAGLAEESFCPAIAKLLETQFHASPYMEKYVLEALFQMGRPQQALSRMKQRYAKMIESPYATLWESWSFGDAEAAKYGGGTYNHGWSGGPITLLAEYVAGIKPLVPNFELFSITPCIGLLERFECSVPAGKDGLLTVRQEPHTDGYQLIIRVPDGCSGTLNLPNGASRPLHRGEQSMEIKKDSIV